MNVSVEPLSVSVVEGASVSLCAVVEGQLGRDLTLELTVEPLTAQGCKIV